MIYIIPDTNILYMNHSELDLSEWSMNSNYYELLDYQHKYAVKILLPDMVLSELMQHRKEKFIKVHRNMEELEKSSNGLFSVKYSYTLSEYETILNDKLETFKNSENCAIILPICGKSFDQIVDDSINKMPPFEGKDGKADKGFKDAVILYSIIEYAKNNKGIFILISNDPAFAKEKGKIVRKRFNGITGSELKIFANLSELSSYFEKTICHPYLETIDFYYVKRQIYKRAYPLDNQVIINQEMPKLANPYILRSIENINCWIQDYYNKSCAWLDAYDYSRDKEIIESLDYYAKDSYGLDLNGRVLLNKSGIVSFLFEGYDYIAYGCHGDCTQKGIVFDINSGEEIPLNIILEMSIEDTFEYVKRACLKGSSISPSYDPSVFEENYHSLEDIHYYISEEGILGFFDVYEAGCYADGFIEYQILDKQETEKKLQNYMKKRKASYDKKDSME